MKQCDWNNDQRKLLVVTVYNNDGHNPSPGQFKVKWEKILSQLQSNVDVFGECKLPNWRGIHDEYKALKAEVIKKYSIDFTEVEHVEKTYTQCDHDWEMTLLGMEREKYIKFSVYPTDEARKKWITINPYEFSLFVSLAFIINFIECIIVGYNPHNPNMHAANVVLLTFAVVIFGYGFCRTLYFFPTYYPIQPEKYWIYLPLIWLEIPSNLLYNIEKVRLNIDREVILELLCYLLAIFFYATNQPGLAALRIFRMFRFFSYFKYIEDPYVYDELPPEWRPFSPLRAGKLCAFYIEQLFQEFFTQKSLGGVIVLIIFFFTAYIVAVVLAYTKRDIIVYDGTQPCYHLRDCYITMIRLILYDGNGFNLLQQLAEDGDVGMVFLLFILMIFNGIILINGLIGIFGKTFTTTDEEILTVLNRTELLENKMNEMSHILKVIMHKMDGSEYDSTDKESSVLHTSIEKLLIRKDYPFVKTASVRSVSSLLHYTPFRKQTQQIANQLRSHPDISLYRTNIQNVQDINIKKNMNYHLDKSQQYSSGNMVDTSSDHQVSPNLSPTNSIYDNNTHTGINHDTSNNTTTAITTTANHSADSNMATNSDSQDLSTSTNTTTTIKHVTFSDTSLSPSTQMSPTLPPPPQQNMTTILRSLLPYFSLSSQSSIYSQSETDSNVNVVNTHDNHQNASTLTMDIHNINVNPISDDDDENERKNGH